MEIKLEGRVAGLWAAELYRVWVETARSSLQESSPSIYATSHMLRLPAWNEYNRMACQVLGHLFSLYRNPTSTG